MTTPNALRERGLLSTGEIATRTGVHRSTVWHWIESGLLAAVPVGRSGRYRGVRLSDLKASQKNGLVSPDLPKSAQTRQTATPAAVLKKRK